MLTLVLLNAVLPLPGHTPSAVPFQVFIGCYVLLATAGICSTYWRGVGYLITLEEFGVVLLACARAPSQEWEQAVAGLALLILVSSAFLGRPAALAPLRGKWLRTLFQGLPILISVFPLWSSAEILAYPRNPVLSGLLLIAAVGAGVLLVVKQVLAKDSQPVLGPSAPA